MSLFRRLTPIVPVLSFVISVACSGDEGLGADAGLTSEARIGLVSVGYEHDWMENHDSALLTTTAQFVRYMDMDGDRVARLLALPLDPNRQLPAMDMCQTYDLSIQLATEATPGVDEAGYVELLEAGDLTIETDGTAVTLYPRHFPGLLPYISGVTYGEARASLVERGQRVMATSSGGESVGPFEASITSSNLPRLIRVGGNQPSNLLEIHAANPLMLEWEAGTKLTGAITYIELRYSLGKRDLALRCRVQDDGAFIIPAEAMSEVRGRTRLEITHLQKASFMALGLEQGELRVTVKDAAELNIR